MQLTLHLLEPHCKKSTGVRYSDSLEWTLCMISKLSNMLLPQMVSIYHALVDVRGASEKDIDEIIVVLDKEGFSSTEPVEGFFMSLDLTSLGLNGKQRTIAQMAQRKGERIGHCEWHNLGMSA